MKAFWEVRTDGSVTLGEKTVTSGTNSIEGESTDRRERSRHRKKLNQRTYTSALAFLRNVDLPVPAQ